MSPHKSTPAFATGGFNIFIIYLRCGLVTAPEQEAQNTLPPPQCRVGKDISAQASHRTVREALTSYGSYYSVYMTLPFALIPPILMVD